MKKKLIAAVVGLLLAVGFSLTLPASPASAHQYSAGTFWVCGATRPANSSVFHSWPYFLAPGVLTVWCKSAQHQWFVDWYSDGTYYRISGYHDCSEVVCLGPSGH